MNRRWLAGLACSLMLLVPAEHLVAQEAPRSSATGDQSRPAAQSPEANQGEADENDVYRKSPTVVALGAKLGLNAKQSATVFEVFNFAVLAVLLGAFLFRALPKTFRNRNSAIQKHLVDARTATEEANARLGSVEQRLGKLDGIIAEMRAAAERDAALDEQRIMSSVEDEKAKILAAAEQEIAAATIQARRELQRYAAELAVEQAGKRLVVDADTDRLLVQGFARRLSESGEPGGRN